MQAVASQPTNSGDANTRFYTNHKARPNEHADFEGSPRGFVDGALKGSRRAPLNPQEFRAAAMRLRLVVSMPMGDAFFGMAQRARDCAWRSLCLRDRLQLENAETHRSPGLEQAPHEAWRVRLVAWDVIRKVRAARAILDHGA